jgi:hypothetical protein
MSPIEILAVIALVAYAVYKQTRIAEVKGLDRLGAPRS